jgi:hypothetical protein
VFRPPDFEFRFNPILNTNFAKSDTRGTLYADASQGTSRWDHDISLQQVSLDMHLRTVSERYDFDRLRIGIQPFTADFRGFLFLDNPLGVRLYGVGADFDVLPELKVSVNANQLFFDDTAVLEATQNGRRIGRNIGLDTSVALVYRPFQTQNVIFRLSGAVLAPGEGFKDLYGDHLGFSVLSNLILAY